MTLITKEQVLQKFNETIEKKLEEPLKYFNDKITKNCEIGKYSICVIDTMQNFGICNKKIIEHLKSSLQKLGYNVDIKDYGKFFAKINWEYFDDNTQSTNGCIISARFANNLSTKSIEENISVKLSEINTIITSNCEVGKFKGDVEYSSGDEKQLLCKILENLGYECQLGKKIIRFYWNIDNNIANKNYVGIGKIIYASEANKLAYENMTDEMMETCIQDFNEKIENAISELKNSATIGGRCKAYAIAQKYDSYGGDLSKIKKDDRIKISW